MMIDPVSALNTTQLSCPEENDITVYNNAIHKLYANILFIYREGPYSSLNEAGDKCFITHINFFFYM